MRTVGMITVLLLAATLAGCTGSGDKGETDSGTDGGVVDHNPPPTGNTTTPPVDTGNGAAGAVVPVLTLGNTSGDIPLDVTFLIDATVAGLNETTPDLYTWTLEIWSIPEGSTDYSFRNTEDPFFTDGDTGMPGTAMTTLEEGDYLAQLLVSYPEKEDGTAEKVFSVVRDGAPPPEAPLEPIFKEDAEDGEAQWTIESWIYDDFVPGGPHQQDAPDGYPYKWHISAANPRGDGNSWFPDYPDFYRSQMTSNPIVVPDDGWTYTLRYWFMGEAEDNGRDGIHTLIGLDGGEMLDVAIHNGEITDWTQKEIPLKGYNGQTIRIAFIMSADGGCSNLSRSPPELCGGGAGSDGTFSGMWLDDISIQ